MNADSKWKYILDMWENYLSNKENSSDMRDDIDKYESSSSSEIYLTLLRIKLSWISLCLRYRNQVSWT